VIAAFALAATLQRDDVVSERAQRLDALGLALTLAGDDRRELVNPDLVMCRAVAEPVAADFGPSHQAPARSAVRRAMPFGVRRAWLTNLACFSGPLSRR